jgi:3-deoxy-D-manno-octulosonic-acid transferase
LALLVVCAPLILWTAVRTGKYRDGYPEKFFGLVPRREGQGTCVWFHAVSVGEVNLLGTLVRDLCAARPEWEVVISTTSRAGFELARKKYGGHIVFYCPLDFSGSVRTALRRVRPTLLVLAELELWPNLIFAAKEYGARVAIINGRLSDKSFPRYGRIRPLIARVLRQLDLIAVQSEESAVRFTALGALADRVCVTGSLKYDGAESDRENPRTAALRKLAGFTEEDIVFLAGSTQEPEEQFAIDIYRKLATAHPRLRLVIVPRHPERFDSVARLLVASKVPWVRRSELDPARPVRQSVLLVDTVGELGAWWGTAHIAFVGGSFGSRGGQNMIEPSASGAAVCFGPNTWNFRDVVASLIAADAAVVVKDETQLEAFVRRCLESPAFAADLGQRAQRLVTSQLGATKRTLELIEALEPKQSAAGILHPTRAAA